MQAVPAVIDVFGCVDFRAVVAVALCVRRHRFDGFDDFAQRPIEALFFARFVAHGDDSVGAIELGTRFAIGVGDVVFAEGRIGDRIKTIILIIVGNRQPICPQVGRNALHDIRGEVINRLGESHIGAVDLRTAAKIVIRDVGDVVLVVRDTNDLLEWVIVVARPDDLSATVVKFLHRGDQTTYITIAFFRDVVGIGHSRQELALPTAICAKAIGHLCARIVRNRGRQVAIQYIIAHHRRLHAIYIRIELPLTP